MYLKSIEIHGFKSFANKILLQFHNGITGIVGPNGSGKSNVADAVRWVLGEQRIKQLRGASMQDVIFSGTELRRPLSYAYVAITLDNSDHQLATSYEEVTVARRLYRSGESEYSINGTTVRLKDVNELFYDTGIGKEGYSIIGQGQIERILSGKPEERRELFDEAAGIVKFKRRKADAQKKLEDERANLVRVSDILDELEKQIGPLERQSEKAKEYLRLRESLKNLEINLFLAENASTREELAKTEENLTNADSDLISAGEAYEKAREDFSNMEQELARLDEAIEQARAAVSDSGMKRTQLEGQIELYRERIKAAGEHMEHLMRRKQSIEDQLFGKNTDIDAIRAEKEKADADLNACEESRSEAVRELESVLAEISEANDAIENSKNAVLEELTKRANIKSKIERCDAIIEQDNIRRSQLSSRMLEAKTVEAGFEEEIKRLEKSFEEASDKVSKLNSEKDQTEEKISGFKAILTAKDEKLRSAEARFHQESSKLEAMRNLAERYEGYGNPVRKVMEQKRREKGLVGVVADILSVKKKYETAIEIALGGSIQNVVTKDEDTAKRMIRYLKEVKGGRVTFLPLDSLEVNDSFEGKKALSEKGVIGTADELVETDPKYKKVASFLLGRILVVDGVDEATRIADKYRHRFRIVTLEGELLTPGGAISGGAYKNNSNVLGKKREIDELTGAVAALEKQIDDIKADIENTKNERNELRTLAATMSMDIQTAVIEQNTARISLSGAREKQSESVTGYDSMIREQREIEQRLLDVQREKKEAALELSESSEFESSQNRLAEEMTEKVSAMHEREAAAQTLVSEWDIKAEKLRGIQSFKQMELDRVKEDTVTLNSELSEIEEELTKNKNIKESHGEDILKIEAAIEASRREEAGAGEKIESHLQKKRELSAKRQESLTLRDELSDRKNRLSTEVQRLTALKDRLESSIEDKITYMWEEYEITLSAAAAMWDETLTDLPIMKKDIAELKGDIKALGDVNVNAIEEYRERHERYTLMKEQYDDLIESELNIRDIIDELDACMRKQFSEKFEEINLAFDRVFKEMFGGGKGTLELMADDDILEAGIRIEAQPPGKKLQNMMQLSGGEKALTAIALLFAIQDLKPSPFCLLDEIEAALDESNVSRFAGYLNKLTAHTQFIVITHRRGTMEKADRLYGITMQEKGISTLVSVDLVESELLEQEKGGK